MVKRARAYLKKEIRVAGKAHSNEKAEFRRRRDEPNEALCEAALGAWIFFEIGYSVP